MTDVAGTDARPEHHLDGASGSITERRRALGLSIAETGRQAGIEPDYLRFIEEHPDAHLSVGSLLRLAPVLKTSPETLLGGGVPHGRGGGRSGLHPDLQALTRDMCELRLAEGGIGRVVTFSRRGPVTMLVSYEYTVGLVVFWTDPTTATRLQAQNVVRFEVDRVDDFLSDGWCVLVTGRARVVEESERPMLASFQLEAWNDGRPHALVAITPGGIIGRTIV